MRKACGKGKWGKPHLSSIRGTWERGGPRMGQGGWTGLRLLCRHVRDVSAG
jgi:hypothetical protein